MPRLHTAPMSLPAENRPPAEGLAARLRGATAEAHARIERTGVIAELIDGTISRQAYVGLLRSLVPVYAALEAGLRRHRRTPGLAPAIFPTLFRGRALAADLRVLAGPDWAVCIAPQAESLIYREHLHRIARDRPPALLAHAYVRYLGDLSGGRLIARTIGERFGLTPDRGLAFYSFCRPDTPSPSDFRRALDLCPLDAGEIALVEREARESFERHARIARALTAGS